MTDAGRKITRVFGFLLVSTYLYTEGTSGHPCILHREPYKKWPRGDASRFCAIIIVIIIIVRLPNEWPERKPLERIFRDISFIKKRISYPTTITATITISEKS